jgi:adenosylcobinamide-phosphate synthase
VHESCLVLLAAYGADCFFGDPAYPLHPVRLIGRCIPSVERRLRASGYAGIRGGALLVAAMLLIVLGAYLVVRMFCGAVHPAALFALDVFVVYSCVALKDMERHALPVASALDAQDLSAARAAVQRIVGRDAAVLDAPGVARAAVESVAESFVDGFFAPLCWFVAGATFAALMGADIIVWAVGATLAYRTVNTLDSTVGYRDERYLRFGRISARLDDALNYVPARLSLAPLYVAAYVGCMDARAGWTIALRDRLKHESPNAAHAESFVAGALGLRLGGPLQYPDGAVEKPWLGDGTPDAGPAHIRAVCHLVQWTGGVSVAAAALLLLAMGRRHYL